VERIDPKALHLSGEFAEQNLGTTVDSAGSITVRVVATQFMFVPRCVTVPTVNSGGSRTHVSGHNELLRLPGTHPRSLICALPGSTLLSSVRISVLECP
jgi:hypothetical protein